MRVENYAEMCYTKKGNVLSKREGLLMRIFEKIWNKGILIMLCVSYSILLIMPIALGITGYIRMENILEKNIRDFYTAKNAIISNEFSRFISALSTSVQQIASDEYVKEFSEGSLPRDFVSAKKFINTIGVNINRVGGVKYMGVYFKNRDTCVTNQGFLSGKELYEFIGETEIPFEEWEKEYLTDIAFDKWSFPKEEDSGNIIYTQSLPTSAVSNINEYFFVVFTGDVFKRMMTKSGFSKDDKLVIYDTYKGTLCGDLSEEKLRDELRRDKYDYNNIYTFSDKSALIKLRPIKSSWRIGIVTYELSSLREVTKIRGFLIFCLFVYCLFGIGIIAFFVMKNYRPIKKIITELEKNDSAARYEKGNELDYIKNRIIDTRKDMAENYNILQTSKKLIRIQLIYSLLNGTETSAEKKAEAEKLFGGKYYVFLVYIKNSRIFDIESEKEINLLSYAVKNILDELISEKTTGYTLNTEQTKIAAIINLPENSEGYKTRDEMNNIVSILESNLDVDLTVGVSTVKYGTSGLSEAYREAYTALDFHYTNMPERIMFYGEIMENDLSYKGLYRYKNNIENQIIAAVVTGDYDVVRQLIRTTFEENIAFIKYNADIKAHLYFEFVQTYLHLANKYGIPVDIEQVFGNPVVKNNGIIEEYIGVLNGYYEKLCSETEKERERQTDFKMIEKIKSYINENYADYNLNVNLVSEKLGIRRQNLNTIIKADTGKTMREYISFVRHEKAKEYLTDTDYSLSQIAMLVGYSSDDVLNRTFKKLEGMTPGQYRSAYKKG